MKAYVLNIAERCENMTTISLRMDDEMKKELDEMCEAMGMNISTFYMVYTKKALRERKIPFEIEAPQDPFYSKTNLEHIRESDRQIKEGKVVVKTMEELEAWKDYLYWQMQDRKTLKKINELLKDIQRTPFDGKGEPEGLRGDLSGKWSRRINQKDRLVYEVTDGMIEVVQCKGHYSDK